MRNFCKVLKILERPGVPRASEGGVKPVKAEVRCHLELGEKIVNVCFLFKTEGLYFS
jgi:hypothetical protein